MKSAQRGFQMSLIHDPSGYPDQSSSSFINRRKIMIPVCLIFFVIGICLTCFAQDEIVIRTFLFRGFHEGYQPGPKPTTTPSDEIVKLPIRPEFHNPDENIIDTIKDTIRSVYRIPYPILLTSAYMIWDGKQENINEAVYDDRDLYPIQLYPRLIAPNTLNLRIQGLKFEFKEIFFVEEESRIHREISYKAGFDLFVGTKKIDESGLYETWLEKELTLAFHIPVVIALPRSDGSLFLSLQAYRREDKRMDAGLVGNRLLSYSLGGTDPVCGKKIGLREGYVPRNWKKWLTDYAPSAKPKAHWDYEGKSYLFCSEECLNRFKEDPEKYLKHMDSRAKAWYKTRQDTDIHNLLQPEVLVIPEYPEAFRQDGREGTIKVELGLDSTGSVRETRVLESADLSFENVLQDALSQWTYNPKIQSGKPVPVLCPVELIFEPRKTEEPKIQENFAAPSSDLMARIADYCSKLENAVLHFFCREKIEEKLNPSRQFVEIWTGNHDPFEKGPWGAWAASDGGSGEKNSFTYDYQVIQKDGRIQERRILLEENGRALRDEGAYPKTKRFYINKAIYGPIGLLAQEEQPFYYYGLLGDETIKGRQAFVIEIRPKKPSSAKPIYGKVWVDKKDASILKMSIEAESLAGYERISADYESRGIKPMISIEIDYGFEKNGLRFPSHITLKEAYSDPKEGQAKMSEMKVDYDKYKFFKVGTEVKY
jgi:TonB family protein